MIKTKLAKYISLGLFILLQACNDTKVKPELGVQNYTILQLDRLILYLNTLQKTAEEKNAITDLQTQFLATRLQYKKIEAVVEYYFQGLTRRINGPALPEVKTDDGQVWPPHGLQVIEQILYSNYHDSTRVSLLNEINLLKADLVFIKSNVPEQSILPRHFQELLQHQCIRMASLGMSGFDTPLCKMQFRNYYPVLPVSLNSIKFIIHRKLLKLITKLVNLILKSKAMILIILTVSIF